VGTSKRKVALQLGNILAFVVTLIVNGLSNTTLIGGRTTADISNLYPTLITPAGYVFAIWGIIYALLFLFVVYQALPSQRSNPFQQKMNGLFILSCAFNVAWLFLWQNNYVTYSLILIVAFAVTLEEIHRRLRKSNSASLKEWAFVRLPFSVYFGWLTIATFANLAVAMSAAGWVTWQASDVAVGIVLLLVALAIVLCVVLARKDIAYGLVAIWALVGIAVNQGAVVEIVYVSYFGAGIVGGVVVVLAVWLKSKSSKPPRPIG
jgi:translocator protein